MAEFIMQLTFCPKKSQRGGFTLLEIMIALAIVSIAMVSLLSLANRSIGVHDRLQRITAATLLAQGKMAETELSARHGALRELKYRVSSASPTQLTVGRSPMQIRRCHRCRW